MLSWLLVATAGHSAEWVEAPVSTTAPAEWDGGPSCLVCLPLSGVVAALAQTFAPRPRFPPLSVLKNTHERSTQLPWRLGIIPKVLRGMINSFGAYRTMV